jgi:hypothetical protein
LKNVVYRYIHGMASLYGEIGRRGLEIPLAAFRERVGGEATLRKVLAVLSVREVVHPGRPRGMAPVVRKAYELVIKDDLLRIPRARAPALLRGQVRGRPFLDGVRPAPPPPHPNAPPPPPVRIPAGRLAPVTPLYEYQEAAIEFLCGPGGALASLPGVAYLQMETGLGKTRVGCGVIARRGEAALVVAPTDAIATQWVDEFAEVYPDIRAAVYHNPPKGSRRLPPGPTTHDVVVVIVNTFRTKEPDFIEGYGTIILDEAHEYHSTHNSRALWLSQAPAVLGLSATPEDRPDGLDRYVPLHLGAVVRPATIPGFDVNAVRFQGAVRLVEYAGHPDYCTLVTTAAGTMSAIGTIGLVIRDPARTRLIVAEVERLCRLHETAPPAECARLGLGPRPESAATPRHPAGEVRRHGVFVFAEHREYLIAIRDAIVASLGSDAVIAPELGGAAPAGDAAAAGDAGAAAASPISVLRGGAAADAVGTARRHGAHVVLTTYGFSRRGISLPDMTAIIAASPRRNGLRQILGRILRRGSDESIVRQVVDIVDVRTGLRGQVTDRRKVYREKGYPIVKASASYEDYAGADAPAPAAGADNGDGGDDDLAGMSMDDLLAAALDQR